ncbi:MAG: hypothetical protein ABEK17_03635 [Candidatus Aenigmatarchaeota archaeon]
MKNNELMIIFFLSLIIVSTVFVSGCIEISSDGEETNVNISNDVIENNNNSENSGTIPELPELPKSPA